MPDLEALLAPRSVAVVGASDDAKTIRGRLLQVMLERGFRGPVYPVSRRLKEVRGLRAYQSLAELPERPDLAIVCTPAESVPEVLEECGRAGIGAALVIASGFAEESGGQGGELQARMREIAKRYGMAVCGPNSTGFLNNFISLAACFSPTVENKTVALDPAVSSGKRVGVTSQSGGFTFAFLSRTQERPIAYSYMISSGNEGCLEGADYVDFMLDDGRTDLFLMYMEGIADAQRFRAVAAKAADARKPIIVLKAGRSEVAKRAAASHTGALSGEAAAYHALFREYGIVEADDIDSMIAAANTFSFCKLPEGHRIGLVSASGGGAVLVADSLSAAGLELLPFDTETQSKIKAFLPAYGSAQNPVDVTANAIRDVGYARIIEIVRECETVDMIVVVGSLAYTYGIEKDREALLDLSVTSGKPVVFCTYSSSSAYAIQLFAEVGIPVYTSMPDCARALKALADYASFQRRWKRDRATVAASKPAARPSSLASSGDVLCEADAKAVLAQFGIPSIAEELVQSREGAVRAAERIGVPVALKAQSPDLLHKTEAGAVVLNLDSASAIGDAYDQIVARLPDNARRSFRGMLVQKMAAPGVEAILGITREPHLGPMLMIGLGGIFVELMNDFVMAPVPVTQARALELVRSLRGARIFQGVRGKPAVDVEALASLAAQLSLFAAQHAESLEEVDLNPVIVHERGVSIVDALIVQKPQADAHRTMEEPAHAHS
jgi:acyl-CoA synthetase (NDP forming)